MRPAQALAAPVRRQAPSEVATLASDALKRPYALMENALSPRKSALSAKYFDVQKVEDGSRNNLHRERFHCWNTEGNKGGISVVPRF